jgi:hypothetical protein
MSREDGFSTADVDPGLMHDPKMIALARQAHDAGLTMSCVGLYLATLLASWRDGDRVSIEDAAPAWWSDPIDPFRARLEDVGLLDADGCVPPHAWDAWFGPARDRRELRREAGRRGGEASAKRRSSTATAPLEHALSGAEPVSPTGTPAADRPAEPVPPSGSAGLRLVANGMNPAIVNGKH